MTTRKYSSRSQQSTLTGAITSGATSMVVVSGTALLGGVTIPAGTTFTLVIDPDTALEEIVDATAVSTNTFTVTRAIDGSTAQAHSAGAVVRHMAIGRDYRDANLHAEADSYYNDGSGSGHTMHGISSGEGVVVGTLKTQTLTNKTLTSPTITDPTITGTASAGAVLVFEGATADAYETTLTVVDPTQDNTVTIPNTTGTVVLDSATQTLTNKTLTSPTISGSPVITGLSSAGMISSSATPKDYVDSILGSATAAATSAASAATSASSAATSATSAANSATAASTSASSASTSASSAATSASSASTQAVNASNYASAAATSATSSATSASSAATSASSASTQASNASTSASSAAASATAASTSASSAATSASSAATSATAAASSATSAAASWDQFDDRYLGAKSTPPTVDNDGNPLATGAIYFYTVDNNMYAWSGSAWVVFTSASAVTSVSGTAGRVSSTGGSSPVIDLVTTAVTSGSYTNASITVDSYGRLTAASSGTAPVTSVTSGNTARISINGTATAPTVDLTTTAVTAGTYSPANITVDAYGRITSAATASVSTDPNPQIFMLMGA